MSDKLRAALHPNDGISMDCQYRIKVDGKWIPSGIQFGKHYNYLGKTDAATILACWKIEIENNLCDADITVTVEVTTTVKAVSHLALSAEEIVELAKSANTEEVGIHQENVLSLITDGLCRPPAEW